MLQIGEGHYKELESGSSEDSGESQLPTQPLPEDSLATFHLKESTLFPISKDDS